MIGTRIATALIGAAAIALPLAAVALYRLDLQTMATKACRCARLAMDATGKASCWSAFDKAAGPVDPNRALAESACMIVQDSPCYLSGGCAVKGYAIAGLPDVLFCTAGEVREALPQDSGDDWEIFRAEGAGASAPLRAE